MLKDREGELAQPVVARAPVGQDQRGSLTIRTEGEQAAVTVFHDEFAGLPRHVAKASREFDTAGGILGVERVRVLNE